jgi:hypothetical protein
MGLFAPRPARRKLGPVKEMMNSTVLWQMGVAAATISANGSSGEINVSSWENFIVMVTVGVPTGSSPTLQMHVDGYDANGNVYSDLCSPEPVLSFSGGGAQNLQATVGLDAQFVASTAPGTPGNFNQLFCAPEYIAIRWVIGGTGSPTFPGTYMSLFGR